SRSSCTTCSAIHSPRSPASSAAPRPPAASWPPPAAPPSAPPPPPRPPRPRLRAAHHPAPPTARQAAIIRDFKNAWQTRDIAALVALLDPGATITADGGGQATAALHPIEGAGQVARYLATSPLTAQP